MTQSILSSYCNYRLRLFSQTLSQNLSHQSLQISHILSIMNQTMYFGMSLGRLGLDFRPLVGHLFEQAIQDRITQQIKSAYVAFIQSPQDSTPSTSDFMAYPALAQLYNRYMGAFNVFFCI